VLLEEGSDPTITNQRGHDAVYEAELNDKREVVEWVLKEGGEGLEEGLGGEVAEADAEGVDNDADVDVAMGDNRDEEISAEDKKFEEKLREMDIQGVNPKN